MPELPDLHVFSRNLDRRLAGRPLRSVAVWRTRRRNFTNEKIAHALEGCALKEIRREGKEVHFDFDNDRRLAAHLMLAGQFDLTPDPRAIKFARLGLKFESGEWLVVSDPHGWATFTLDPPPETAPDALAAECDVEYLSRSLHRCAGVLLKGFLVDQNILRGIGNAYADEILWASRIAPQSLCDRLPKEKVTDLHGAIRAVLMDAIAQIERLAPEAINGEIRDFLKVHHSERTLCPAGHPIRCEMVAMKKTYYCDEQVAYL
jgi:formamidopyrimidine-DNA glycosylase